MRRDLENGMVLDALWSHAERHINAPEPAVIGECYGCNEDITEAQTWLEMELNGCTYLVHDCEECAYQFVAGMSRFHGGGD
jgi:hypothetical protein